MQKKMLLLVAPPSKIDGSGHWQRMLILQKFLVTHPSWWWTWNIEILPLTHPIHQHSQAYRKLKKKQPRLIIVDARRQDPRVFRKLCPVFAIDADNKYQKKIGQQNNHTNFLVLQNHNYLHKLAYYQTSISLEQYVKSKQINQKSLSQKKYLQPLLIHPFLLPIHILKTIIGYLPGLPMTRTSFIYGGSLRLSSTKGHKLLRYLHKEITAKHIKRIYLIADFSPYASTEKNFFGQTKHDCIKYLGKHLHYMQRTHPYRYLWRIANSQWFMGYFGQSFFEAYYLLGNAVFFLPVQSQIHRKLALLAQQMSIGTSYEKRLQQPIRKKSPVPVAQPWTGYWQLIKKIRIFYRMIN